MKNDFDYNKLSKEIAKTFESSSFYWQSMSLILCFIFAYLFYKIIRKSVLPKITSSALKRNPELNRLITRYFIPLLYPLLSIFSLAIGWSIYSQFFPDAILFSATIKLLTLFLFLRFLRISSNSTLITNVIGLILVPTLALDIFGLLDATILYLDDCALKIGNIRISVYLVIKAFIVLVAVFWLSNLVSKKSKSYIDSNKTIKTSTKHIISKFIDITIYSIITLIILKTFGFDMTTLAVIGGAIGVGIGFGLQKIASNFISGIILLFEKSIEIGDWIELDNGGILGVVKAFSGRYTLIESFDGKEIMVPNEDFIIGRVVNLTYSNNRARIEIAVGVAYGSDLEKVKELMIAAAKEQPRCLNYPEIECYVTNFGDYDIKFLLYFWVSDVTAGRMSPKSDVIMNIWKKFKEHNIEIPVPKREVQIRNNLLT